MLLTKILCYGTLIIISSIYIFDVRIDDVRTEVRQDRSDLRVIVYLRSLAVTSHLDPYVTDIIKYLLDISTPRFPRGYLRATPSLPTLRSGGSLEPRRYDTPQRVAVPHGPAIFFL